ncbi:EscU/YscU/HrcU family type III secretion system export apparatus switch protein [Oscillospiraceae bacterium PP1C4]
MSKSRKNKAVALKYHVEEDAAPVVIASGYGTIAQQIIDIAEQKGIPVFRDDSAASLMCMLEVGSNIPAELYEVIAAIYCQLLQTSSKIKNNETSSSKDYSSLSDRSSRFAARRMQKERKSDNDSEKE